MNLIKNTTRLSRTMVLDGDTIMASIKGKRERIRLRGIDAPEIDQPFGDMAADFLKERMRGEVRLRALERDQYGRLIGWLYRPRTHGVGGNRGWQCLNVELVRAGLAYAYPPYGGDDPYIQQAQRVAKNYRLGIWQSGRVGGEKPWDTRNTDDATRLLNAAGRAVGNWVSKRIYIE